MPNLPSVQEVVEQIQHFPSVENPLALAGSLAVATTAAVVTWRRHGQSSEAFAMHSTNPELLEQTIIAVDGADTDIKKSARSHRLSGGLMSLIGLGMLVGAQLAHPTYETEHANSNANTILLLDTSSSMDTADLGQPGVSRLQSSANAIATTSFKGKLGVVEFAAANKTRVTLSQKENQTMPNLAERTVDPNGGNLVEALQASIDLLPSHSAKDNKGKDEKISRDGTVTIITDGTVDSSKKEIKDLVTANDVDLNVIVTGTPEGTYEKAGQSVSSAIQPDLFSPIGKDNITIASTQAEISKAVHETVKDASTNRQEHDWQIANGVALILLASGIVRVNWQTATKKV